MIKRTYRFLTFQHIRKPQTNIGRKTKKQRALEKEMYAAFFGNTGLVKTIKLEGQKLITSNWYTTKCLSEIIQKKNVNGAYVSAR